MVSGQEFVRVKGTIEELVLRTNSELAYSWQLWDNDAVEPGTGLQLVIADNVVGWMGLIAANIRTKMKLSGTIVAAEISVDALLKSLKILPQLTPINPHPLIERDLNFVLPESVQWKELTDIISAVKEPLLQNVVYKENVSRC